jgi:hypothetical protein
LDVQQYFIDIEFALYKYKNYIIEGMNKKIEQLENNQKQLIKNLKDFLSIIKLNIIFL